MLKRTLAVLVAVLAFTGPLHAEVTRGHLSKVEEGSVTIRTLVVRFDEVKGKNIGEFEEMKFKLGKDVQIVRRLGKGMEDAKMTLDELKAAMKAAKRVTVRITHEGENCSVITVLPPGLGGGEVEQGEKKGDQVGSAPDQATLAEVRKLQEKRRDVLRDALAVHQKLFQTGHGTLDGIVGTSKRLLAAELDLATTDGERIAVHERHVEQARLWFALAKARQEAGRGTAVEALEAQAAVLEAEIGLLKAGGKRKKAEQ
jgi:hypothetical protein